MQSSIQVGNDAAVQYLLRIGDTTLILGQRLGEWTGHAPILEEDMAMANNSLDLIGQARLLYQYAAERLAADVRAPVQIVLVNR